MSNPAAANRTKGPYYEFQSNRLVRNPATNFLSYLDPYGTNPPRPFVYFSSGPGVNDYNPADCAGVTTEVPGTTPVQPYTESAPGVTPVKFVNSRGFQIICAGADGKFGQASMWTPAAGSTDPNGKDDQANFGSGLLGAPQ